MAKIRLHTEERRGILPPSKIHGWCALMPRNEKQETQFEEILTPKKATK